MYTCVQKPKIFSNKIFTNITDKQRKKQKIILQKKIIKLSSNR